MVVSLGSRVWVKDPVAGYAAAEVVSVSTEGEDCAVELLWTPYADAIDEGHAKNKPDAQRGASWPKPIAAKSDPTLFGSPQGSSRRPRRRVVPLDECLEDLDWESVDVIRLQQITKWPRLDEFKILRCLEKRFHLGCTDTWIGSVLVSINPYDESFDFDVRTAQLRALPPEEPSIVAVAQRCLEAALTSSPKEGSPLLCSSLRPQAIVISGEAGAGKTEASKMVLAYLTIPSRPPSGSHEHIRTLSGAGADTLPITPEEVQLKVRRAPVVAESFGNASTRRNGNSSRYGRLTRCFLNSRSGALRGFRIVPFLLEKNRLISVPPGEQTFHALRVLHQGARNWLRQRLPGPFAWESANRSDAMDSLRRALFEMLVRQPGRYDVPAFSALKKIAGHTHHPPPYTLDQILEGFVEDEQLQLVAVLLAVCQLLSLAQTERFDEKEIVESPLCCDLLPQLLGLKDTDFVQMLTHRAVPRHNPMPRNKSDLQNVFKAAATDIYERLFVWLLDSLTPQTAGAPEIAVLDIFGFEVLQRNSLEQFNINIANEKLQYLFVKQKLNAEIELLCFEGILKEPPQAFDNAHVIELCCGGLSAADPSIAAVLNDCTLMPDGGGVDFLDQLKGHLTGSRGIHFHDPEKSTSRAAPLPEAQSFIIDHSGGRVTYHCHNWTWANRDKNLPQLTDYLARSRLSVVQGLSRFPQTLTRDCQKFATVTQKFSAETSALEFRLADYNLHFVKCIRANGSLEPGVFCRREVALQIARLGLVPLVQVLQSAYAYRLTPAEFLARWQLEGDANMHTVRLCLREAGVIHEAQVGRSFVFLSEDGQRGVSAFTKKIQDRDWMLRRKFSQLRRVALAIEFLAGTTHVPVMILPSSQQLHKGPGFKLTAAPSSEFEVDPASLQLMNISPGRSSTFRRQRKGIMILTNAIGAKMRRTGMIESLRRQAWKRLRDPLSGASTSREQSSVNVQPAALSSSSNFLVCENSTEKTEEPSRSLVYAQTAYSPSRDENERGAVQILTYFPGCPGLPAADLPRFPITVFPMEPSASDGQLQNVRVCDGFHHAAQRLKHEVRALSRAAVAQDLPSADSAIPTNQKVKVIDYPVTSTAVLDLNETPGGAAESQVLRQQDVDAIQRRAAEAGGPRHTGINQGCSVTISPAERAAEAAAVLEHHHAPLGCTASELQNVQRLQEQGETLLAPPPLGYLSRKIMQSSIIPRSDASSRSGLGCSNTRAVAWREGNGCLHASESLLIGWQRKVMLQLAQGLMQLGTGHLEAQVTAEAITKRCLVPRAKPMDFAAIFLDRVEGVSPISKDDQQFIEGSQETKRSSEKSQTGWAGGAYEDRSIVCAKKGQPFRQSPTQSEGSRSRTSSQASAPQHHTLVSLPSETLTELARESNGTNTLEVSSPVAPVDSLAELDTRASPASATVEGERQTSFPRPFPHDGSESDLFSCSVQSLEPRLPIRRGAAASQLSSISASSMRNVGVRNKESAIALNSLHCLQAEAVEFGLQPAEILLLHCSHRLWRLYVPVDCNPVEIGTGRVADICDFQVKAFADAMWELVTYDFMVGAHAKVQEPIRVHAVAATETECFVFDCEANVFCGAVRSRREFHIAYAGKVPGLPRSSVIHATCVGRPADSGAAQLIALFFHEVSTCRLQLSLLQVDPLARRVHLLQSMSVSADSNPQRRPRVATQWLASLHALLIRVDATLIVIRIDPPGPGHSASPRMTRIALHLDDAAVCAVGKTPAGQGLVLTEGAVLIRLDSSPPGAPLPTALVPAKTTYLARAHGAFAHFKWSGLACVALLSDRERFRVALLSKDGILVSVAEDGNSVQGFSIHATQSHRVPQFKLCGTAAAAKHCLLIATVPDWKLLVLDHDLKTVIGIKTLPPLHNGHRFRGT